MNLVSPAPRWAYGERVIASEGHHTSPTVCAPDNCSDDCWLLSPGSEKDITEVSGTSSPGSTPGLGIFAVRNLRNHKYFSLRRQFEDPRFG